MKSNTDRKHIALLFLAASGLFFIMGFMFPILVTGWGIGPIQIKQEFIYLSTSFRYFFNKGEIFVGLLLLFFTIIFPILKYIFILLTLLGQNFPKHHTISTLLGIINKWSMLDVFVVALLILNMKFDSAIIVSRLGSGATLFAISVVLLMICSMMTKKVIVSRQLTAGSGLMS
jgi:paraquat-inducible protein A